MKTVLQLFCAAFLSPALLAQDAAKSVDQVALARSLGSALVRVEYYLQFDRGQSPEGRAWTARCPDCGQPHVNKFEDYVREERPCETAGFLVGPTQVLAADLQIHSRFIKSISVTLKNDTVPARRSGLAKTQNAVRLDLEKALPSGRPLLFDPSKPPPYFVATYSFWNGDWTINVQPLQNVISVGRTLAPFLPVDPNCLLVDQAGVPAGLCFNEELPADNSWKGSPLDWPMLTEEQITHQLAALRKVSEAGLLRVALSLRSPKTKPGGRYHRAQDEAEESETEKSAIGLMLDEKRLLVLASLKPKVTARLQRIQVFGAAGKVAGAKFTASLKSYGAFVAELAEPLSNRLQLAEKDILGFHHQLLWLSEVRLQGEQRIAYESHGRIAAFQIGWKRQIYPELSSSAEGMFLFDETGNLVAAPIALRQTSMADSPNQAEKSFLIPALSLKAALQGLPEQSDPANVPLNEEEENRLAWMGVELQALNRELARANGVSDQTRDGETGALVTFVYPESPAAQAGIEPGFILLRLHLPAEPAPIEFRLDDDRLYQQAFPWDRLDQISERYFDQIPTPWAPVENALTRLLTDLGLGNNYKAEFFANGKVVTQEFKATASPPHYESAPRSKSNALGLTIRDLTYEVRRYLQRKPDEPGVVISKIEPGSRAAISGIKPYEVITHLNNQAVANVRDFEKLTSRPGELNLAIKRMASGRLVTIRPAPTPANNASPDK